MPPVTLAKTENEREFPFLLPDPLKPRITKVCWGIVKEFPSTFARSETDESLKKLVITMSFESTDDLVIVTL